MERAAAVDPTVIPGRNIMVIAPHPDDESLGCGGLISSLAEQGRRFYTVFVTDGAASHPASREWPRSRLTAQREREAADALSCLGVGNHPRAFLRLCDAAMPRAFSMPWYAALAELVAILRSFRPDLVLLPWRRDPHCDHRNSWRLISNAIRQSGVAPMMLEYAVWLNELGKADDYPKDGEAEPVIFDISATVHRKRAAIAAHLSQLSDLIDDDPNGFRLTAETIARLSGPLESYWRVVR